MSSLWKRLRPSTSNRGTKRTIDRPTELLPAPYSSSPAVATHDGQQQELDFAALQHEQQTLFAKEFESQWANHNSRLADFDAFLKDIEAQVDTVAASREETFSRFAKEWKEIHAARNNLLEGLFSTAESQREQAFHDDETFRKSQLPDVKRIWESRFHEGREERRRLLNEAEAQLEKMMPELLKVEEKKFEDEEWAREEAFGKLLAELASKTTDPPMSSDAISPLQAEEMQDMSTLANEGASNLNQSGLSEVLHENEQTPSNTSLVPKQHEDRPFVGPVALREFCRLSLASYSNTETEESLSDSEPDTIPASLLPITTSALGNELSDPCTTIQTSPAAAIRVGSVVRADAAMTEPGRSFTASELPEHTLDLYKYHQQSFNEAQVMRQELFEQAEIQRFGFLANFNDRFSERMLTFRIRFESRMQCYSDCSVATKFWDTAEKIRDEQANLNRQQQQQAFNTTLKRLEGDFELANQAEALWEQEQKGRITRRKRAMFDCKNRDQARRFDQAQRQREDALQPFFGHPPFCQQDGTCLGMDAAIAADAFRPLLRLPNLGEKEGHRPSWEHRDVCGSIDHEDDEDWDEVAGPDLEIRSVSLSNYDTLGFSLQTLFVNQDPLIRRSLPLPQSSPLTSAWPPIPADSLAGNLIFKDAQRQRDILFETSTHERGAVFAINEAKRKEDIAAAQAKRLADFQDMRLEHDRCFQEFIAGLRRVLRFEEQSFLDAYHRAGSRRASTFSEAQAQRAEAWEATRKKPLAASFQLEEERLVALEKWALEVPAPGAVDIKRWRLESLRRTRLFSQLVRRLRK